jgi:hypothetical protein
VILITDGEPFYSRNAQVEAESEAAAAEALHEILAESPQVILHTVCFENWVSSVTHEAATSGDGVDALVEDVAQAADAGREIAAFHDAFYALRFPLKEYSDDLSLRVSNMQIVSIRRTGDLTVVEPGTPGKFDDLPVVVDTEPDGPKVLPDEDTPTPGTATEPPAVTPEQPESTPAPAETEAPDTGKTDDAEPTELPENPQAPSDGQGILIPVIIAAAAVVVVVVVVLLIVLLRRRKKTGAPAQGNHVSATKAVPGAIPMRLEVVYGNVKGENRQFYLSEELRIGSDPQCDLVLLDGSVAPIHTRIFRKNGAIYVEDMNTASGTAVGGMRIYAPNQLRSGNQILVGQVCIVFYF